MGKSNLVTFALMVTLSFFIGHPTVALGQEGMVREESGGRVTKPIRKVTRACATGAVGAVCKCMLMGSYETVRRQRYICTERAYFPACANSIGPARSACPKVCNSYEWKTISTSERLLTSWIEACTGAAPVY